MFYRVFDFGLDTPLPTGRSLAGGILFARSEALMCSNRAEVCLIQISTQPEDTISKEILARSAIIPASFVRRYSFVPSLIVVPRAD
jgi:hypothetical protein